MNRREFLKAGAASIAAMSLPVSAENTLEGYTRIPGYERFIDQPEINYWADFNPRLEYGNSMPLTYQPPKHLRNQLVEILYRDMVKWIPPGFRERVEIVQRASSGRQSGIAWLYQPPKSWEPAI